MRSLHYDEVRSITPRRAAGGRMPILWGLVLALTISGALWATGVWLALQLWLAIGRLIA